ncbi:MAG: sulfate ester transporter substrate-binding protein [Rhodospirillales bacterium]|nr:sulfate ester transporter substrate-binding protein [Rhodospirillales bacterium]
MIRIRQTLLAAAVAIGSVGVAAAAELPPVIHFAGVGSGFGLPFGQNTFAVAQVKGVMEAEFAGTDVRLDWGYFTGTGPAINEALANGQADFAQYGSIPNIIGYANGLPTRILLSYGGTNIFAVARKDLPIQSIKDLRGRKIAVQKATIIHWALLKALQANGLTERDVTIVDLKNPDTFAALAAGSIDAAFGASYILPLRDQGIVKVIYSTKDGGAQATGFGAIVVTDSFQKRYPEATQRVVDGLVKAGRFIGEDENREEVLRIWAKSGVPYEIIAEDFAGKPLRAQTNPLIDDFYLAQFRDAIEFEKQQKLIRRDVDLTAWLEPRYLADALKRLDLENFWPHRSADGLRQSAAN